MNFLFEVTKVLVVVGLRHGPDKVSLQTSSPSPFVCYSEPLCLDFDVTAGNGVDYLVNVLNVPRDKIEVIDANVGPEYKFSEKNRQEVVDP